MNDILKGTVYADPTTGSAGPIELRRNLVRAQIMDHLATRGASRVSDISDGVGSPRASVQYHLLRLEDASIVRSNIPAGERARSTPYYYLTARAAM